MTYIRFLCILLLKPRHFRKTPEKSGRKMSVVNFCAWLAANPDAGDVIPGSGGCRKIRWGRTSTGKRGGARVIYFTRLMNGEIWLLVIYDKRVRENIPAHILKAIREELENE